MKKQNFPLVRTFRNMAITTIAIFSLGCSQNNAPIENVSFKILGLGYAAIPMDDVDMAPARGKQQDVDLITELWVIEGNNSICHQSNTDADFCNPSIPLTLGSHTLTFIGSSKTGQWFVSGVWSADKISDTYGAVKSVNVTQGMSSQSVSMKRATYAIRWASTDTIPSGTDSIFITISNHRSTLKDGLAGGDAALYKYGVDVRQKVGQTYGLSVSGFCETINTEEQVTTTFVAKDVNKNTIASYSKDVMVLSNRRTVISGAIFSAQPSCSVTIDDTWLDDLEVAL